MGKEKILRPDSGTVKAMMETASRIDAKLQQIAASEDPQRRRTQEVAQRLYDDRIREELEAMDVEHINKGKQGIRVGLLRSNGVETVWQTSRLSFQQICDIDGLGEQSALKIRDTVEQIIQNTKDTIRIRIRMENPGQVDDDLIRALHIRIHSRPLREEAKQLYQCNHGQLQQELALAKKSLSGLGWMFKSRTAKQQITAAVESLRTRLEGDFGSGVLPDAWRAVENASSEFCWRDYKNNAPVYYAELENLGLYWEKQETAGGLPAQLAAQIEAQQLDLKYLKATGNHNANIAAMKPSILESSISNFYLAQGCQLTSMQGCESRLEQLAKQQEKEIRDVESGLFQMQMLTNWSDELQILLLEDTLESNALEYWTETYELYEAWCAGDEAELRKMISDEVDTSEMTEEELAEYEAQKPYIEEYNKSMSYDRNDGMLEVAKQYLESGDTVFFAVGLAHLLNNVNGLVDALRAAGYTVEPVQYVK